MWLYQQLININIHSSVCVLRFHLGDRNPEVITSMGLEMNVFHLFIYYIFIYLFIFDSKEKINLSQQIGPNKIRKIGIEIEIIRLK